MKPFLTLLLTLLLLSSGSSGQTPSLILEPLPQKPPQISQYIRRMFQDRNGNLWFGTNDDGVARYGAPLKGFGHQSPSLTYFGEKDGLKGRAVRSFAEDRKGDLWIATDAGVSRFDGEAFNTFGKESGLGNANVWSLLIDRSGALWCGTDGGLFRSDAESVAKGLPAFKLFPLPEADLSQQPGAYPAPKLVNSLFQDKAGNLWFGTNGLGVFRYDGTSAPDGKARLTQLSKKEGLADDFVGCILQDDSKGPYNGDLWFGTRFGGLSRYDGVQFTNFTTQDGLTSNFVWTLLQDNSGANPNGDLWIGSAGGGLMRYDGTTLRSFTQEDGLPNRHVQSLLKDRQGRLWVGTSGGAFRFEGGAFLNVTQGGPW